MTSSIDRRGEEGPRTVLITGASRGLGQELAQRYAAAGWRVIACSRQPSARNGETGIERRTLDVTDVHLVERHGDGVCTVAASFALTG